MFFCHCQISALFGYNTLAEMHGVHEWRQGIFIIVTCIIGFFVMALIITLVLTACCHACCSNKRQATVRPRRRSFRHWSFPSSSYPSQSNSNALTLQTPIYTVNPSFLDDSGIQIDNQCEFVVDE